MKRLFNIMLAVLLMVMLSACGKPDSSANKVSEQIFRKTQNYLTLS